jgi:Cytochrome c7 and related cytochrome c
LSSDPESIGMRTEQERGTDDLRKRRRPHAPRQLGRSASLFVITSVVMLAILVAGVVSCHRTRLRTAFAQNSANPAWTRSVSVFTPARASLADAFKEYVGWQSKPVQPIAFNHKIHLQNNIDCTNCHEGVTQGPNAGIPSVSFCMACHQAVAMDKPEIKKLAAYADKGQDVPWQRVYWFYPEKHVRFWHSPHINAGVNCKECHGDLSQQTVALRSKDLTMNFCLNCHRAKGASVDCTTCHY